MHSPLSTGEQEVRAIIDAHREISFETGVVRQGGLSTMLDKRLGRFEAALELLGPVPHVDIGEN